MSMKAIITTNEGQAVGVVDAEYNLRADDIPATHRRKLKDAISEAIRTTETTEGVIPDDEMLTPPEEEGKHSPDVGLRRLKHFVPLLAPYQVRLAGNFEKQDDDDDEPEQALEIRDYYRVWIRDPDQAPDGVNVLGGDGPAGNEYYYEVPFESSNVVDIGKADVDRLRPKNAEDAPSHQELVDCGVPDADLRLVEEVQQGSAPPELLRRAQSSLTLFHLSKWCATGSGYESYLPVIKAELESRGVAGFERLTKARRYVDSPDEVPEWASLEEGPQGGLYYETDAAGPQGAQIDDQPAMADPNATADPHDIERRDDVDEEIWNALAEQRFEKYPERIMRQTLDVGGSYLSRVADRGIASRVIEHVSKFTDDSHGSRYSQADDSLTFRKLAPESEIGHEFGHATAGAMGYGPGAREVSMFAHLYTGEVPEFEFGETYAEVAARIASADDFPPSKQDAYERLRPHLPEDKPIKREHFHLVPNDDHVEHEAFDQLIDGVNRAFDRIYEAKHDPEKDVGEYLIDDAYSTMNCHETLAVTNEILQTGASSYLDIETLYTKHNDLLAAYLNVAEPGDLQKGHILHAFDENGPTEHMPDAPFGMGDAPESVPAALAFDLKQEAGDDLDRAVHRIERYPNLTPEQRLALRDYIAQGGEQ